MNKFSLLLISVAAFLMASCGVQTPTYERLKVVGVLDTCSTVLEHGAATYHYFGKPQHSTVDKKGNGTMTWEQENRSQSYYQKPIYVDTETSVGTPYPSGLGLYSNTYTVPVTTTTHVYGGGIGVSNHLNSYKLCVNLSNWKITSYSYTQHGYKNLTYRDTSSDFITKINIACRFGELEDFKSEIAQKPRFFDNPDNIIRCAIEAAKYDRDNVVEYIMRTYNIDIDKKVKSYIVTRGYLTTGTGFSAITDQYYSADDAIHGAWTTIEKRVAMLSVRDAATQNKSKSVIKLLKKLDEAKSVEH